MPISTNLYTELRFTISDYVQRREWKRLFEACGTEDDEVAKTIAVIMGGYDPAHTWAFLDYALTLPRRIRLENEHAVATLCYILARMGQSNVRKSLSYLKELLSENQNLRDAALVSLSNLWVLETRKVSELLLKSWLLKNNSEVLQDAAVRSCEYLAQHDPVKVSKYLGKVSTSANQAAAKTARLIMKRYLEPKKSKKQRIKKQKLKKNKKKRKHMKK